MDYLANKETLHQEISKLESDNEIALTLLNYCCFNKIRKWKDCISIANQALKISLEIGHTEYIGLAYLEIGYQNWFSDKYEEAFQQLKTSQSYLIQTNNYFKYSRATAVKSSILWSQGERKDAIEEIFNGLRHVKKSGVKENALWLHWFLGIYYSDLKDFENCEKQYVQALSIIEDIVYDVEDAYAYCLIGYGGVLLQQGRKKEAFELFIKAKETSQKNELWMQEARVLNDLGNYYIATGQVDTAEKHFHEAYIIRKEQNTKPALITSILALAKIKLSRNIDDSLEYALEAKILSEQINSKVKVKASNELLAKIYKKKKELKKSYFHLEEAKKIGALISSDQLNSELKNLESKFITELLNRESAILSKENDDLVQANEIIKKQFKEISDSIYYARRIQHVLLPNEELVKSHLTNSMIVYTPKDIVAGDFYWMESVGDIVLFAVADCTGHGVPGAMISIVCSNSLNRIVREFDIKKPSVLLDKVRSLILSEFNTKEDFSDGMDISLCALDTKTNKMEWAGANNPLWIVRNNSDMLEEIKGDKQPIGNYPIMKNFTNHTIQLHKGDCFYLFSDGFSDQFGGIKGKKYMKKRFKNLVLKNAKLPICDQKSNFITEFDNWKGNHDQVDDVCVVGVKI